MSNPGIPEVFFHWFKTGLCFSCHQRELWSVLITIEAGLLLAAHGYFQCQCLPCVTDIQKTRRPTCPVLLCALGCYVPVVASIACLWGRQALRYEISQRRSRSRGSTNLFFHQQELCCQVSTSQSLQNLKIPISCGPSRWVQTFQSVSEFLWKGAGDQDCIWVLHSCTVSALY